MLLARMFEEVQVLQHTVALLAARAWGVHEGSTRWPSTASVASDWISQHTWDDAEERLDGRVVVPDLVLAPGSSHETSSPQAPNSLRAYPAEGGPPPVAPPRVLPNVARITFVSNSPDGQPVPRRTWSAPLL